LGDIGGGGASLGRRSWRPGGGDGAATEKASGFSAGSLGLIILPPAAAPAPLPLRAFSKKSVYGTLPSLSQLPNLGTCAFFCCCIPMSHTQAQASSGKALAEEFQRYSKLDLLSRNCEQAIH
jgi:hypothetical protein